MSAATSAALVLLGAWALTMSIGCGRIDYGLVGDAGTDGQAQLDAARDARSDSDAFGTEGGLPDALSPSDARAADAPANDAPAVCGDDECTGAAGETCADCPECDTTVPVCGNSLCNPSESGSTCPGDCGPSVWDPAWTAEEREFVRLLNEVRTAPSGLDCPDAHYDPVGPLTEDTSLRDLARTWSWATALAAPSGGFACNGASYLDIANEWGVDVRGGLGYWSTGGLTAADAVEGLIGDPERCRYLMGASYTAAGAGYVETPSIRSLYYYFR